MNFQNVMMVLFFNSFLIGCAIFNVGSDSQMNSEQNSNRPILAINQNAQERKTYEAKASRFIIATQGQATAEAAKQIFKRGGNIIDAAVAASFAISVERPQSTGLGGGGFLLYREAKTGKIYAIDFRERAPQNASEKMYLNAEGQIIADRSSTGILSIGVPGLVAGLVEVHKKFGKLPLSALIQPAINLAEKGIVVYPHLANAINLQRRNLEKYPASREIFLKSNGEPYYVGETLVQSDLGKTLKLIARQGKKAFYSGEIAKKIVEESSAQNGLLTMEDLSDYQVKWRSAVRGSYKGYDVVSFPPPSSGGTHVIQILNILESDVLRQNGFGSSAAIHLEASAMQQAFADRANFMGDPDFFKEIPLKGLISKSYAKALREKIDFSKVKSADQIQAGPAPDYESSETTNFSMMDAAGNVVVSTQTINGHFGSKVVVPGTGIVLNNEMDDFSAKPGSSNAYGAIGGIPNSIQPHKTPLSSMAPTFVLKDGKPVMALGAPGGTRIITCVAQTILNYLDFKLPLYESIAAIRLHHQWKPDQLDLELPGPGGATLKKLKQLGYKVNLDSVPCRVNAVAKEGSALIGVADPRDIGAAIGN